MHILLVEHDPDVRRLMAGWLSDEGHDIVEAIDFPSGLRVLTSLHACDAVITAVVMPGGSGLDLARLAQRAGLPVLLCTGDSEMMMWLEARGVPHLRKPFYLQSLTAWLAETFAEDRPSRATRRRTSTTMPMF